MQARGEMTASTSYRCPRNPPEILQFHQFLTNITKKWCNEIEAEKLDLLHSIDLHYNLQEAIESSAFPNKIKMTLIKLKMYKLMNIFCSLKLCKSTAS